MLALKGVGKRFGTRVILRRITLSVPPGSVSLLVGPNGAGKTTLLRLIAGLIAPDAGEIRRNCPDSAIGYLGHATFLYGGLTAVENLSFWDRLNGGNGDRKRLMAALDRVELTPFAEARAGTFSRGMAQRLNLARVLLQNPSLLLLDEPATGLDQQSTAMLRREIHAARSRGAAVIWITHDPETDHHTADTVFGIESGTLAFCCPAALWPERHTARTGAESC